MKIAVSAKGKTLDEQVDPRFGRCLYFVIVDSDTMNFEVIENPNQALGGGAGIQSAQLMAQHDVKVVLTGNTGPNAYQALSAADIQIVAGASGTVREAVENWKTGKLSTIEAANVESHFGMKKDDNSSTGNAGGGMGGGGGRGMGGGGGRGR
ncbi:MAG: NifB/NifX family molybdenum-iron cluster-binding protein [Lentisphaeria bacterium]